MSFYNFLTKQKQKIKQTRTKCIGCPNKPGLCSIEHLKTFHEAKNTQNDYIN